MTTTYTWGEAESEIEIEFSIIPGEPMTFDYPGSPAEVDIVSFACKENPAMAVLFEINFDMDDNLRDEVEQACLEHAEAMWELSQCDD